MKAQLEEECRQTIFFFKGHSYPKLYYNKMNTNQKPTANTVSSTKRTTLCRMRRLKNFCLSKLLCICPFFSKNISIKKQSIASTEISLQFIAPKVPLFGKNKAAISSTSSYPSHNGTSFERGKERDQRTSSSNKSRANRRKCCQQGD